MIKFSIVLPVRNGGEYVKECVNSILTQSYTNFTLQILDNNSNDGTYEWLSSLNDPRIEIHRSNIDLSIEDNWARVLQIQKNEFMSLIGHDDLLYPNYLMVMHDLVEKNQDASLYLSHFDYIDSSGNIIRHCKPMSTRNSPLNFLTAVLTSKIDINGTGFLIRSVDYDKIGGIPPYPSLLFADFELWINLVNLSYLVVSDKSCFAFRLHISTTSSSADLIMLKAFNNCIRFLLSLSKKSVDFKQVITTHAHEFLYFHCKGLSHRLIRTSFQKRNKLTVYVVVNNFIESANSMKVKFYPFKKAAILIALIIDSNFLTRKAFLIFKYFFKKPLLK